MTTTRPKPAPLTEREVADAKGYLRENAPLFARRIAPVYRLLEWHWGDGERAYIPTTGVATAGKNEKASATPGPWTVAYDTSGMQHGYIILNSKAPNLADAALIAAAPDLLAALRLIAEARCERRTQGSCWDQPHWTVDAPYTDDRVCDTCIATRAITKAEGR